MKTAFITGASSGIGRATAVALGCGRVPAGRNRAAARAAGGAGCQLASTPVHILAFDVRDRAAVQAAVASLPAELRATDVLVNNAGSAHGLAPIQDGDPADWDQMLDANVRGLLNMTHAVLPGMTARQSGFILNVGSIAGPGGLRQRQRVLCHQGRRGHAHQNHAPGPAAPGMRVAEVNPGAVETEFSQVRFKGDEARAAKVYQGFEPLRPEDIADIIVFMVTRPPHVTIAEVLVLAGCAGRGHYHRHVNQRLPAAER